MLRFSMFFFMLLFLPNVCFAEDIWVGEFSEGTRYVRSESIKSNISIIPGQQDSKMETTFISIIVPNNEVMEKLKKLTLCNEIAYQKETYSQIRYFDRINEHWKGRPTNELTSRVLCDTGGKELFETTLTITNRLALIKRNATEKIDPPMNEIVRKYIADHWDEIVKVQIKDR